MTTINKTKLVRLLKNLDRKEMKAFRNLIISPFLNKNKKCIELFDFLVKFHPEYSDPRLSMPNCTDAIYKNKNSMSALIKDMIKLLENFFIQMQLKEQEMLCRSLLMEELVKRNEMRHFNLIYERGKEYLKNKGLKDNDYYKYNYSFEKLKLRSFSKMKHTKKEKATQFNLTIEYLDKNILTDRLFLANIGNEDKKLSSTLANENYKNSNEIFEKLIEISESERYEDDPMIKIQKLIYEVSKKESSSNAFEQLKEFHDNVFILFSNDENHDIYIFLINFCIRKIIEGNKGYYKKLYDVYLSCVERKAFFIDNHLPAVRLKNMVIAAVKSEEGHNNLSLAKETVDKFINHLPPSLINSTKYYLNGYIFFNELNYDAAETEFIQCIAEKSLFKLDSQIILYKIYYETEAYWAFEIPYKSLLASLKRNKNNKNKKSVNGYLNFLQILKLLFNKKTNPNYKRSLESIAEKLDSAKVVSDKAWLLERIREF